MYGWTFEFVKIILVIEFNVFYMIYIDNSTKIIEIPRISSQFGEKAVFVNQTTKAEISVEFVDDGNGDYYKVPIEDNIKYLDAGQYDYCILNNSGDNIAGGILQFDDFGRDLVEYSDDISVIQYTPDDEYNPIPDRVLDITENGRYNVKNYDAVDVDINPSMILPNGILFTNSTWTICPAYDYRNVTRFYNMFSNNSDLEKIEGLINTGNVTTFYRAFYNCSLLKEIPPFDSSKATNMAFIFDGCESLKTVPEYNTSNVTDMGFMFSACESLETVPEYNTSNVTNMQSMFYRCDRLKELPYMDTSKVTTMRRFFGTYGAWPDKSHIVFPEYNTSNVTDMTEMFAYVNNLHIPLLDCGKVTSVSNMFQRQKNMTIDGLKDMGKGFTSSGTLDISYSPVLGNSIQNIIDSLYDMNNKSTSIKATLKVNSSDLANMTDEQKAQLAAKRWILTS